MDRQSAAGGDAGGCVPQGGTVRDRFIAEVRDVVSLSEDERERVLDMGLRALRGEAGLGVV